MKGKSNSGVMLHSYLLQTFSSFSVCFVELEIVPTRQKGAFCCDIAMIIM